MRKILTASLLVFTLTGLAQQRDSLLVLDLEPVTISSLAVEERPSFNLLPAESISSNNGYEVQNVLNLAPGVFMHSGTLSTNRITIRGIGNRSPFSTSKLRAYLEEIPLTSGIGETSLEDIDLSFIKEIEIWKGPTASRYGAGLGGMIHYRIPDKFSNGITFENLIGSAGLYRGNISLSRNTNAGDLLLNGNITKTDGWRQNSEYQRNGINAIWQKVTPNSTTRFLFLGMSLRGEIPSSLDRDDYLNNPSAAAFTWNAVEGYEEYSKVLSGLSYTRRTGSNSRLRVAGFFKYRDAYESRPFNILEDGDLAGGLRITSDHVRKNISIKTGLEYYRENYPWKTYETNGGQQGPLLSDQEESRNYLNLFLESQISLNEFWSAELGLNLNDTRYNLDDKFLQDGDLSGEYSFGLTISPNFNIRYRPDNNQMYYITMSHGLSNPSLEETLTPDGLINEEIGPETGWNLELGSRGYISPKFNYDVSIYNMWVSNLLVTRFREDINTGFDQVISVNAGGSTHTGIDLLLSAELLSTTRSNLNISAGYSFQNFKFQDFIDGDDDYTGNSLTGTIPHRITSQLNFKTGNMYLTTSWFFTDRMPMRDDNSVYSDSYSLINLKSGYNFKFNKISLDLFGGLNNLFDTQYASMVLVNAGAFGNNLPRYYYPGQPRNFYLGLKVSL